MSDRSSRAGAPNPLLATKLYVPQAHSNRIKRLRLTERLNEGLKYKLTLVSAPPGFGKTSLLSEWIPQSPQCVAWLSLDEGDNDPARFWAYLIAALQTLHSSIGRDALSLLQSPQPLPIETVLVTLVNEIDGFPDSFGLVLDDYHVIESRALHDGLTFFLEHLPPRMHLIITTRADPPLPLAELRARAELIELRAADLRFTSEETTAFLNTEMGLRLSAEQSAELERRTEGWIAGLQLAALSLRDQDNPSAVISAFSGSHRFVLDYLTDQVLERSSENIQDFLLQTSILDRLNGSLCDAVTGRTDGQQILEQLERGNLFLFALDDERRWYRYHALFAEVLRHRLQQTRGDSILELHRRASEWFEREGLAAEAVSHAVAARDWEPAVHLIVQAADVLRQRGETATLASWMQAVPDEIRRKHPAACLAYARALVNTAQFSAAEEFVTVAEQCLQTKAPEQEGTAAALRGKALALRASLAVTRGNFTQAVTLSRQALELLPPDETTWQSLVALNLAGAYRFSSDWGAASQAYLEASSLSQSAGDHMNALSALSERGEVLEAQGQLRQAVRQYDQVLDFARDWQLPHLPVIGYALVGLGRVWCEWNDLDAALLFTQAGLGRGKQANLLDLSLRGYLVLARIRQAQGDVTGTLDMLREADKIARQMGVAEIHDWIDALRAQAWLVQRDLEPAVEWASHFGSEFNDAVYPAVPYGLAQVWLMYGQPEKAVPLLDHALQSARSVGRLGNVVYLLALKALVLHAQGNSTQALATLGQSLELAEPEGHVRVFVEAGPSMVHLLQRFAQRGEMAKYVEQILAAMGEQTAAQTLPSTGDVETLTRRERQVLRLIVDGATNQEIARELVLTVNTVKKHTSNIFAKLGVSSRTQAIARARELNLL